MHSGRSRVWAHFVIRTWSLALNDKAPQVRAQALVLAEPRLDTSPRLRTLALDLAEDPGFSRTVPGGLLAGSDKRSAAISALAQILRTDGADRWIRKRRAQLVWSTTPISSSPSSGKTRTPTAIAGGEATRAEVLDQLVQIVGVRGHDDEIARCSRQPGS